MPVPELYLNSEGTVVYPTDPDKLAKHTFFVHATATEGGASKVFGPLTLEVSSENLKQKIKKAAAASGKT